jgi:hypothetical protein
VIVPPKLDFQPWSLTVTALPMATVPDVNAAGTGGKVIEVGVSGASVSTGFVQATAAAASAAARVYRIFM